MRLLILFMLISFNIFAQIDTTAIDTLQTININFNIDTLITDTMKIDTLIPNNKPIKRDVSQGIFVYETIDTIYVGEPIVLDFSLSKDIPIEKVVNAMKIKKYKSDTLKIDRIMQITIFNMDEENLVILPTPKPIEHTMADGRHTPWFWTLKTKKSGTVCFTVDVSYILNGKPQNITYIEYKIHSISKATFLEKIQIFFIEYWQWIFGTFASSILLPITFFVYNKKKNK